MSSLELWDTNELVAVEEVSVKRGSDRTKGPAMSNERGAQARCGSGRVQTCLRRGMLPRPGESDGIRACRRS